MKKRESTMKEIWKAIDDRYSVSNLGRVKSNYANKERILKPFINKCGYLLVDIRHPHCRKTMQVHRLVAMAFIPNPNNCKEVNHKDENKTNNCVDNLEWCDTEYNCNYGTRNKRKAENCKKKILSLDPDGTITYYDSRNEAGEILDIDPTSISKALSDKYQRNKTAAGKQWFYNDGNIEQILNEIGMGSKLNKKKIYSVDVDGNIEHYESISEAHRQTGINNIGRSLKNGTIAGGRRWFYDE